jgi:hypothetical protein
MHAWAALKGGDPTAYHGGQVSLSPIPHIQREPIGMLVLPLLTAMTQGWAIGWASAPYPRWTVQKRQLIDSQNRQFLRAAETGEFYFAPSSVRKSVWTLVRQLRGPHLSTCA